MGREIYHIDPDTLPPSVLSQPVIVCLVRSLAYLGKHIRQNRKSSSPEVYLEPVQLTRPLQSILDDVLLVTHVPRKKDEHILDIGFREVPHPVVTLDLVSIRELDINSSNNKCFTPQLAHCWNFFAKHSIDSGLIHFLEDVLVRV